MRQHIMEHYAAEYDRVNAVYRRLFGINLPRHKFYAPLTVKSKNAKGETASDPVTGFEINGGGGSPGSLKSRSSDAIAEPEFRSAIQTFLAHTRQMEHWIAYAPLTQEMSSIFNNRELQNSIEAKCGKQAVKVLSGWVNEILPNGGTKDAAAFLALTKKMGTWIGNASSVALVGRVGTLAVQATQLAAGLAEMPTKEFMKRFAKLSTGRLEMGWSAAHKSDYIQRRLKEMPPAVRLAMEGLLAGKPNLLKYGMSKVAGLIGGTDALMTAGTYAICYDYHYTQTVKSGASADEAASIAKRQAEIACDKIAQPTRMGARSYRENVSTNPVMKLVWAFGSEPRQKMACILYAMANSDANFGAKARALMVYGLIPGAMAALIRGVMRDLRDGGDDEPLDDKNWDPTKLVIDALSSPIQGIPWLGDAVRGLACEAAGIYSPDGNLLSSVVDSWRGFEHLPDWFKGERELEDAIKDAEKILSGVGVFDSNSAALASGAHLVRDLYGMGETLVDWFTD